jgi:hypothetical protein
MLAVAMTAIKTGERRGVLTKPRRYSGGVVRGTNTQYGFPQQRVFFGR